jgi:hypothetical protein
LFSSPCVAVFKGSTGTNKAASIALSKKIRVIREGMKFVWRGGLQSSGKRLQVGRKLGHRKDLLVS